MWDLRRLPGAEQLEITREWSGILTQGTEATATLTVRNGGGIPIEVASTDFVNSSLCDSARERRGACRARTRGTGNLRGQSS